MKKKVWIPIVSALGVAVIVLTVLLINVKSDTRVLEAGSKQVTAEPAKTEGDSTATVSNLFKLLFANDSGKEVTDVSKAGSVTVLFYMNGSDLESDYQEATTDISEMVAATQSDNVKVVIQTMGTRKWSKKYGIAADHSQRYLVVKDGLKLVDDNLGQLDCTRTSTLADFIKWGTKRYPADRYILMFWNHGGGPVIGYGYDEFQSEDDAMTIDEIQLALSTAGVHFDFIGMDCCIMSCLEVCCACYDYCDYMILSEDFESGLGWSYTGWLSELAKNPSTSTAALAKIAIDDMVAANEKSRDGDSSILALIDESVMKVLYAAWKDFAYANEDSLLGLNYSRKVTRKSNGRMLNRVLKSESYSLSEYYIADIMSVAQNIECKEQKALSSALNNAIVYMNATSDDSSLTGLSVSLPYGDPSYYNALKSIYGNCGFDEEYIKWLEKFTSVENSGFGYSDDEYYDGYSGDGFYCENGNCYYDYSDWDDLWNGWDSYEDDYDWAFWDDWNDEDYWAEDGCCGFSDWDYTDYWADDWYNYDYYDYYLGDNYWDDDSYDTWDDDDYDWDDDDYDWDDDDSDGYDDWDDLNVYDYYDYYGYGDNTYYDYDYYNQGY